MLKPIVSLIEVFLSLSVFADLTCTEVKVTDGNTINVPESGNTLHKIRLTSIDAPERGQPYGRKPHEYHACIAVGKQVFVEANKRDRYGLDLGRRRTLGLFSNYAICLMA